MEFITGKHISRRAVLRGLGATVALPLLDAMVPARKLLASTPAGRALDTTRLICIEMVHGAAGSNEWGAENFLWAPEAEGSNFDLGPSSLSPLEPYRDQLTIISNTDVRMAEAFEAKEIGGDHFRSSATFLTQAHASRPRDQTCWWARPWIRCMRSDLDRIRRSPRCSSASRTWTKPVVAPMATPACTRTPSVGRRPRSHCQ